jgi:hypothetical protein
MTIVKNEHGQMDVYAKEPVMYITDEDMQKQPYAERAEIINARFAIFGLLCGLVSYIATGKLFLGLY